jgi:serine phosphatase RsbU (regulator of sigma subunit)
MLTRILTGTLTAFLFTAAVVTFYDFAGSPTDENLFSDLPGHLAFRSAHPSMMADWGEMGLKSVEGGSGYRDHIRRGDLLVLLSGKSVSTLSKLDGIRSAAASDSLVSAYLLRPSRRWTTTLRLPPASVADSLFAEIPKGALVINVTSGGASDRAGMLVGDIIVRINGKEFANAQEGDVLLRSAQSGHVIIYDVLRDLTPVPLPVTLARFGFPLSVLILSLSGLLFMGVGAFIVLQRPKLLPARLLGLGYLLIGFAIAVIGNRRESVLTTFVAARWLAMVLSIYFGTAIAWHSSLHFPSENTAVLQHRWTVRVQYALTVLFSGVTIALGAAGLLKGNADILVMMLGMVFIILYGTIVRLVYRYKADPEARARRRIVKFTGLAVAVVNTLLMLYFIFTNHFDLWGFIGFPLALLPLATLYTIGRFRLLDMTLRVRRTIQYVLSSVFWAILVVSVGLTVLTVVLALPLHLPLVSIHGTSIEIRDAALLPGQANGMERLFFVCVGLLAWLGIVKVRKYGQVFIDRHFDRAQYDYRRALAEISTVCSTNLSMAALGKGIVTKLVDLMKLREAGIFFFKDEQVCCCREAAGIEEPRWGDFCRGREETLASAVSKFSGQVTTDLLTPALSEEFRENAFRYIVPVRSKDKLIAVLALGEKLSEAPFTAEDSDFLSAVASQASVAIENAFLYEELAEQERLRHELEIARRIQLASLPQETPRVRGLDIAGRSVPALEVGGDFFDYLPAGEGEITVVIGDVSGKGTSAALYMSRVQGILRSLHTFIQDPSELFVRANLLLREGLERSSYVTALGVKFTPAMHTFSVARAGHLPLYHVHASSGRLEQHLPRGLGLGLDAGAKFSTELEEFSAVYQVNDLFVMVTDGITEARDARGDELPAGLLEQAIRESSGYDAATIRDRVFAVVQEFAGRTSQHDDQTIVVVRVTE